MVARPSPVFIRFLAAGGIAAAVNIAARILFNRVMSYQAAVVVSYLCGMATAFLINRHFVFAGAGGNNAWRQMARFTLVNIVALSQVWVISVVLARTVFPLAGMAWHPDTVAHVIGVGSPALASYFAHKHFSFL